MVKLSDLRNKVDNAKAQSTNAKLAVPVTLQSAFSDAQVEKYRQLFSFYDTNDSGAIDRNEVARAMENIGQKPSKQNLDNIFPEADKDGKGSIDFGEFLGLSLKTRSLGATTSPFKNPQTKDKMLRNKSPLSMLFRSVDDDDDDNTGKDHKRGLSNIDKVARQESKAGSYKDLHLDRPKGSSSSSSSRSGPVAQREQSRGSDPPSAPGQQYLTPARSPKKGVSFFAGSGACSGVTLSLGNAAVLPNTTPSPASKPVKPALKPALKAHLTVQTMNHSLSPTGTASTWSAGSSPLSSSSVLSPRSPLTTGLTSGGGDTTAAGRWGGAEPVLAAKKVSSIERLLNASGKQGKDFGASRFGPPSKGRSSGGGGSGANKSGRPGAQPGAGAGGSGSGGGELKGSEGNDQAKEDEAQAAALADARRKHLLTVPAKYSKEFGHAQVATFRQLFALFDADGSGAINRSELAQVLQRVNGAAAGGGEEEQRGDALMAEADENGDGEIDFGEFCGIMCEEGKAQKKRAEAGGGLRTRGCGGGGCFVQTVQKLDAQVNPFKVGDQVVLLQGKGERVKGTLKLKQGPFWTVTLLAGGKDKPGVVPSCLLRPLPHEVFPAPATTEEEAATEAETTTATMTTTEEEEEEEASFEPNRRSASPPFINVAASPSTLSSSEDSSPWSLPSPSSSIFVDTPSGDKDGGEIKVSIGADNGGRLRKRVGGLAVLVVPPSDDSNADDAKDASSGPGSGGNPLPLSSSPWSSSSSPPSSSSSVRSGWSNEEASTPTTPSTLPPTHLLKKRVTLKSGGKPGSGSSGAVLGGKGDNAGDKGGSGSGNGGRGLANLASFGANASNSPTHQKAPLYFFGEEDGDGGDDDEGGGEDGEGHADEETLKSRENEFDEEDERSRTFLAYGEYGGGKDPVSPKAVKPCASAKANRAQASPPPPVANNDPELKSAVTTTTDGGGKVNREGFKAFMRKQKRSSASTDAAKKSRSLAALAGDRDADHLVFGMDISSFVHASNHNVDGGSSSNGDGGAAVTTEMAQEAARASEVLEALDRDSLKRLVAALRPGSVLSNLSNEDSTTGNGGSSSWGGGGGGSGEQEEGQEEDSGNDGDDMVRHTWFSKEARTPVTVKWSGTPNKDDADADADDERGKDDNPPLSPSSLASSAALTAAMMATEKARASLIGSSLGLGLGMGLGAGDGGGGFQNLATKRFLASLFPGTTIRQSPNGMVVITPNTVFETSSGSVRGGAGTDDDDDGGGDDDQHSRDGRRSRSSSPPSPPPSPPSPPLSPPSPPPSSSSPSARRKANVLPKATSLEEALRKAKQHKQQVDEQGKESAAKVKAAAVASLAAVEAVDGSGAEAGTDHSGGQEEGKGGLLEPQPRRLTAAPPTAHSSPSSPSSEKEANVSSSSEIGRDGCGDAVVGMGRTMCGSSGGVSGSGSGGPWVAQLTPSLMAPSSSLLTTQQLIDLGRMTPFDGSNCALGATEPATGTATATSTNTSSTASAAASSPLTASAASSFDNGVQKQPSTLDDDDDDDDNDAEKKEEEEEEMKLVAAAAALARSRGRDLVIEGVRLKEEEEEGAAFVGVAPAPTPASSHPSATSFSSGASSPGSSSPMSSPSSSSQQQQQQQEQEQEQQRQERRSGPASFGKRLCGGQAPLSPPPSSTSPPSSSSPLTDVLLARLQELEAAPSLWDQHKNNKNNNDSNVCLAETNGFTNRPPATAVAAAERIALVTRTHARTTNGGGGYDGYGSYDTAATPTTTTPTMKTPTKTPTKTPMKTPPSRRRGGWFMPSSASRKEPSPNNTPFPPLCHSAAAAVARSSVPPSVLVGTANLSPQAVATATAKAAKAKAAKAATLSVTPLTPAKQPKNNNTATSSDASSTTPPFSSAAKREAKVHRAVSPSPKEKGLVASPQSRLTSFSMDMARKMGCSLEKSGRVAVVEVGGQAERGGVVPGCFVVGLGRFKVGTCNDVVEAIAKEQRRHRRRRRCVSKNKQEKKQQQQQQKQKQEKQFQQQTQITTDLSKGECAASTDGEDEEGDCEELGKDKFVLVVLECPEPLRIAPRAPVSEKEEQRFYHVAV